MTRILLVLILSLTMIQGKIEAGILGFLFKEEGKVAKKASVKMSKNLYKIPLKNGHKANELLDLIKTTPKLGKNLEDKYPKYQIQMFINNTKGLSIKLIDLFGEKIIQAREPITRNKAIKLIVEKLIYPKFLKPISKHPNCLPAKEIEELAKIAREKGIKEVNKILGKKKLPNEVLEDTYLRILIKNGKVSRAEAKELFRNLSGVEGFRTTLSKSASNSANQSKGHLYELRIANEAKKNGFEVEAIGKKFNDGKKGNLTDIDISLRKNGEQYIIEAKNYTTNINMDMIRKDMNSLLQYKKICKNGKISNDMCGYASKEIVPVFVLKHPPPQEKLRIIKKEAEKRGIKVIIGNESDVIKSL